MDPKVSKWMIEYLIRQKVDDDLLDRLMAKFPLDEVDYGVKKGLVLRRIHTEVSKGLVSEKILDLLELIVELDFYEGKFASEAMGTAYSAVALDCTVRFLEVEDKSMYFETFQKIWRVRFKKVQGFGFITEKLCSLRDSLLAASSNVEIHDKILSKNTRYEALKAVKAYVTDSWGELGPPFLQKTAEDVRKAGQGIDPLVGKQGPENVTEAANGGDVLEKANGDLENVTGAGDGDDGPLSEQEVERLKERIEAYNRGTPSGTPSAETEGFVDLDKVTEAGRGTPSGMPSAETEGFVDLEKVTEARKKDTVAEKEQGLEGLENVNEVHDVITPSDRQSAKTQGCGGLEKATDAGKRDNVLEKEHALENVNEARDGVAPTDRPCADAQGSSRQKHVGARRKISYGGGTKAKLSNTEDLDKDPSMNEHHCCPTTEVNPTRADLPSSFSDLNAVVRDPLPEALKTAEGVSSHVPRDAGMNVESIPTDKRGKRGRSGANSIRAGGGHPEREEPANDSHSMTSDPVEFTPESSPKRRRRRSNMTPSTSVRVTKPEQRRQPRRWSATEEETLRKGVNKFGRGNWKAILTHNREVFEGRTEVDLKDKWRNLTRQLK